MSQTNIQIVEGYIEQIINQRRLERLPDFCSEDCVSHAPPYVGLGGNFDDTSGEKLILTQIASNSPMDGHLQIGDELIRVKHGDRTWEKFDELRKGFWARGLVGTEICVTVKRHGNTLSIPLTLGQVEQFDINMLDVFRTAIPYMQKYWPDLKMDIKEIFGSGDMVACYAVNHGTNTEYNRSAVWDEMDIFKLKDGKITEIWGIENSLEEIHQLGYQVNEPVRELA